MFKTLKFKSFVSNHHILNMWFSSWLCLLESAARNRLRRRQKTQICIARLFGKNYESVFTLDELPQSFNRRNLKPDIFGRLRQHCFARRVYYFNFEPIRASFQHPIQIVFQRRLIIGAGAFHCSDCRKRLLLPANPMFERSRRQLRLLLD